MRGLDKGGFIRGVVIGKQYEFVLEEIVGECGRLVFLGGRLVVEFGGVNLDFGELSDAILLGVTSFGDHSCFCCGGVPAD